MNYRKISKRWASLMRSYGLLVFSSLMATSLAAAPIIASPSVETLTLVAQDNTDLVRIDGLATDAFGNVFAALEANSSAGGLAHINLQNAVVTRLLSGIRAADQIDFSPDGALWATNEIRPANVDDRLYRITVNYDATNQPVSASAASLTLSTGLDNPEGLIALPDASSYGPPGHLLVGEDLQNGRIVTVDPNTGIVTELVAAAALLGRPEGFAYGVFGSGPASLFAAENLADRIIRIASDGMVTTALDLGAAGFSRPDNIEFGPDGLLYTSEDLSTGGRLLRADAAGNIEVLASGFNKPAGMVFDSVSGDLLIAEQGTNSLWRLSFAATKVSGPGSGLLMLAGLLLLRGRSSH